MILQNGKRIDGCSDTVPVGTLQPYLGLVPPKGYLLCQGQLVSKTTYSKLYEICGNLFGEGTDTEFRLPDLRGKTIVGFDEGDTLLNVIGEILGSKTHAHTSAEHSHTIEGHTHTSAAHTHTVAGHTHTSAAHTHTTGNHTLTVAEIPAHSHAVYGGATVQSSGGSEGLESFGSRYSSFRAIEQGTYNTGGGGAHNHGNTGSTTPGNTGSTSLTTDSTTPGNTGSTTLTTNNTKPGDTGEADNYQPSIVMNWIVKAVMLIPEYFVVENTLNSDSEDNALSAKQGKLLNEKFVDYATKSEMIQYLPLKGGTLTGSVTMPDSYYYASDVYGLNMNNSDIIGANAIYFNDECGADEGLMFKRSNGNWDTLRAINGGLYLNVDRTKDMSDSGTLIQMATRADVEGTVVFNGQGSANWLSQDTTYSFDVSQYKYLLVHFTSAGVSNPTSRDSGNAVNQVVHIDLTTPTEYPICNVDGVYYRYGGTETHLDMQFLFGASHDPGMFFSGLFVSEDKKKIYVGNSGYVVLGTSGPTVQWGSLYNGVSRIVGFK